MLDYKKIGNLICSERQKIGLTQDDLGEKLFVTRQAISKWENGKCMPDYDSLIGLSELFSITLNELITGERINSNNKTKINNILIDAMKEKDKKRILLTIIFSIIIFILLFFFLSYYFISTYNKLRVFKFSGENENFYTSNIIGVFSNENSYIKLDSLLTTNNSQYNFIEIYYLKNNEKNIICKTSDTSILITDFNQYNQYFNFKEIDDLVNNFYIDIYYDDNIQTIKLNSIELYSNKSLFFKKYENIAKDKISKNENNFIPKNIYEEFKYQNNDTYILEGKNKTLLYNKQLNLFIIEETSKKYTEKWIYNQLYNTITYQKYKNDKLIESSTLKEDHIDCKVSKCKNHDKKYDYIINKYIEYYFN